MFHLSSPAALRDVADEAHTSAGQADSGSFTASTAPAAPTVPFGRPMRALFNFRPTYTPLNHGSYGTFPRAVMEARFQLLRDFEERPSVYHQFVLPPLTKEARRAVAPLLGADVDEVVFVANATMGVNTVLRNLRFEPGDVVLCPETIYPACLKTIEALGETVPVEPAPFRLVYPVEDDEVVALFEDAVQRVREKGKRIRLAIFDTIVSLPGVRVPWERLVNKSKELGILSLVDAAHAVGHIDMAHTGEVKPDFLVSNCHKWLYTPRGSAVFYVPFENQHYIKSTLPTSHGYEPPAKREGVPTSEYFTNLFQDISTADNSQYLCVHAALQFRNGVCGGEARIRGYCHRLAAQGGDRVAKILGTEVLNNNSGSIRRCNFANVRIPLKFSTAKEGGDVPVSEAQAVVEYFYDRTTNEFDTYFQIKWYEGALWVRFSAQVYLEMADFEWGARTLLELCDRVKTGKWKRAGEAPAPVR